MRKVNFSDDFKRTVNHQSYLKTQTISMHYVPIYQCSFHKSYNAQNCILMMNEKKKKTKDRIRIWDLVFSDFPKAFDCLKSNKLIAKLRLFGFN